MNQDKPSHLESRLISRGLNPPAGITNEKLLDWAFQQTVVEEEARRRREGVVGYWGQ